jgi:hypothetical protein
MQQATGKSPDRKLENPHGRFALIKWIIRGSSPGATINPDGGRYATVVLLQSQFAGADVRH